MSYERRVKIVFHGYLKKLHDGELFMSGFNAAEIINGLMKMIPELKPRHDRDRKLIQVQGFCTKESLYAALPPSVEELHICPAMIGGKGIGGIFKIVLGAVLIAAAFYMPFAATTLFSAFGTTVTVGSLMFNFGMSLVLGGLMEFLSPAPKNDTGRETPASGYLGANQNTTRIGTRIALLYGEFKVPGHILSYNVDAKDMKL